jgi:hypothetical protein
MATQAVESLPCCWSWRIVETPNSRLPRTSPVTTSCAPQQSCFTSQYRDQKCDGAWTASTENPSFMVSHGRWTAPPNGERVEWLNQSCSPQESVSSMVDTRKGCREGRWLSSSADQRTELESVAQHRLALRARKNADLDFDAVRRGDADGGNRL